MRVQATSRIHPSGGLACFNAAVPVRSRLLVTLFGGSALGTLAYILAITVTAIVAEDIAGSARWSGVPPAMATAGAAAGAPVLSRIMARSGRRPGLIGGILLASAGAGIAGWGTIAGSFAGLTIGSFALGFGRASQQLARYAAADLQPHHRRATAISWLVWAGTIGSVAGPQLLAPAERLGETLVGVGLAGPHLVAMAVFALAGLGWYAALRPDPADLAFDSEGSPRPATARTTGLLRGRPNVWVAASAMWLGHYAMVQVMAMTPVFLSTRGETLAVVGGVISVHTLGMFALSPVTGWLTSRVGPRRVIGSGVLLLVTAAAVGYTAADGRLAVLYPALFLLGLGWNLTFIAGSALLIEGLAAGEGVELQGWADSGVWVAGGVASIAAGVLLDGAGFAMLNVVAGVLATVPAVALGLESRVRRHALV